MELTVLGAGPAYSDRADSSGAAYLVATRRTTLLLDLGQGSFPRLARRIEPSTLDAVLVSHLHPDHFIDLVALRHYLRWEFDPPKRVRVLGPAGLADRLAVLTRWGVGQRPASPAIVCDQRTRAPAKRPSSRNPRPF